MWVVNADGELINLSAYRGVKVVSVPGEVGVYRIVAVPMEPAGQVEILTVPMTRAGAEEAFASLVKIANAASLSAPAQIHPAVARVLPV